MKEAVAWPSGSGSATGGFGGTASAATTRAKS